MLTSIAYFDPTIIIKKLKKLKRSITDITGYPFMYMQRKEFMKEMDMLYIYVYSTDDIGTSKTYDRTEYFKIKDQIRENMKTIQLIGYHDNNWC
jgi:hypothetical protein